MKFDVFFSICQTEVDGYMPSERVMFENFFSQLKLADELGYGTAWVAETHLSCEIQKHTAHPVIPHFKGEIGLNTDILQLAHQVFARTKNISVGSAVRNILCNGGPIAHAEAVRTFLTLHGLAGDPRPLNIGFASGRFEFSNRPYGIRPRNAVEAAGWPAVKGKILLEATEIFLRLLKGEKIARADCADHALGPQDFRKPEEWRAVLKAHGEDTDAVPLEPFWNFEKLGVIPFDAPLDLLKLTIGTHDPASQALANSILPVGVFNLSITPPEVIESTHEGMQKTYHPAGGTWRRELMPRTAMVFVDDTPGVSEEAKTQRAKTAAQKAWVNYWKAMEGTLDQKKVDQAVGNTLAGSPQALAKQIREKYHPDDRLMLWFDFNNHDNEFVKRSMRVFQEKVADRCNA
ncbi:MAG TPA: LLM class flavin-dependent oxidoreductase [Bdellovibrionales bacterium]|nr:LLM class flavin-dependent oxidoreductase [Bdellovibrionales bacterium]